MAGKTKITAEPEGAQAQFAALKSGAYSMAGHLRGAEWGTDMGHARLQAVISEAEVIAEQLRQVIHAWPDTPLRNTAQRVRACRADMAVCGDGVVAFDPDTYERSTFVAAADQVPTGLAYLAVKHRYPSDEREAMSEVERLWLITLELGREAGAYKKDGES
jgi:hypothetical protein